jgi:Family of unknown function (DUF5317)
VIGLVIAVAVGILVGFVRGGSLKTLGDAKLAGIWVVFAGVVLQLGSAAADRSDMRGLSLGLVLASFACVFTFAAINFRLPGMTLIAIGALCNLVVISANAGMPVSVDALERAGLGNPFVKGGALLKGAHHALHPGTRFRFLADVIPITVTANVVSIGDIIIWAGLLLLVQQLMIGPRGKRRRGAAKAQPVSARSERG